MLLNKKLHTDRQFELTVQETQLLFYYIHVTSRSLAERAAILGCLALDFI